MSGRDAGNAGRAEGRAERRIALAFGSSTVAALGLTVVYVRGGHAQAEGVLLGLALGGIGYGLIEWGRRLMPGGGESAEYGPTASPPSETAGLGEALDRSQDILGGRRMLIRMLAAAAGALGLAAILPVRSLGPRPGRSLFETAWRRGLRLVTEEGRPVRVGDLEVGSVVTVFPENHLDDEGAQTLLIRVPPEVLRPLPDRDGWAPQGHVAYSKICTHAGCPVGLYRAATQELSCPCHQSTFDVLAGAAPVFGPATRPLPQLPLAVDEEGFLVALGDFSDPVGPGFWNRDRPPSR